MVTVGTYSSYVFLFVAAGFMIKYAWDVQLDISNKFLLQKYYEYFLDMSDRASARIVLLKQLLKHPNLSTDLYLKYSEELNRCVTIKLKIQNLLPDKIVLFAKDAQPVSTATCDEISSFKEELDAFLGYDAYNADLKEILKILVFQEQSPLLYFFLQHITLSFFFFAFFSFLLLVIFSSIKRKKPEEWTFLDLVRIIISIFFCFSLLGLILSIIVFPFL